MSDESETKARRSKPTKVIYEYLPPSWCDSARMTDEQFIEAALNHYLVTSDDASIKATRHRAAPLLRILYGEEIAAALDAYRKHSDAEPV